MVVPLSQLTLRIFISHQCFLILQPQWMQYVVYASTTMFGLTEVSLQLFFVQGTWDITNMDSCHFQFWTRGTISCLQ